MLIDGTRFAGGRTANLQITRELGKEDAADTLVAESLRKTQSKKGNGDHPARERTA